MGFMGNGFRLARPSLGVLLNVWQEMARDSVAKYSDLKRRLAGIPAWAGRLEIENWLGFSYRSPDPEYWFHIVSDYVRTNLRSYGYEETQNLDRFTRYLAQFDARVKAAEDLVEKAGPFVVVKPDGTAVVLPGAEIDIGLPPAEGTGIGTIAAVGAGAALVIGGLYAALS